MGLTDAVQEYCVKSVQIRSNFWSVFSCIRTRNNSVFEHFSHSGVLIEKKLFYKQKDAQIQQRRYWSKVWIFFCFLKMTILVPEHYRYEGYKNSWRCQDFYLVKLFYQFLKHLVLNDINHSAGNAFVSEKPDLLF